MMLTQLQTSSKGLLGFSEWTATSAFSISEIQTLF